MLTTQLLRKVFEKMANFGPIPRPINLAEMAVLKTTKKKDDGDHSFSIIFFVTAAASPRRLNSPKILV